MGEINNTGIFKSSVLKEVKSLSIHIADIRLY
jgi:hypothetical protein